MENEKCRFAGVLPAINTDGIRSVLFGLDRKLKIYFVRLLKIKNAECKESFAGISI